MSILQVKNLKKIYTTRFGGAQVQALRDVSFSVGEGEYVAIMGESGSGKTTLLNILASLDRPTGGEVLLNGREITTISEKEISAFRRENMGFVFQDFNLLDTFSIKDNILLPLVLAEKPIDEMEAKLAPLAQKLGIHDRERAAAQTDRAVREYRSATIAFRVLDKNNHFVCVRARVQAVGEMNGDPVVLAVYGGISSENKSFENLVDNIAISIYVIDKQSHG